MTAKFNAQVMNDYVNAVMAYSGDASKDRFWSNVKWNEEEYDILYDFFPTYITVTLCNKFKDPLVMTRFTTGNGWPHYDIVGWVLNNISDDYYSNECDYDDECSYDNSELFDYLEECEYDDENDDDDENNE